MTSVRSSPPLVGRDSLVRFTVGVAIGAPGAPRAVILVGDPGIGKSALLRNAMAEVMPSARVLFASGTEPDHVPAFTGLAELIRPIVARSRDLPPELRDALHDVLVARADSAKPGPALIQQAVLALLAVAAADLTLVLVLDDFDRFEPDSRQVLSYVIGRVPHMPVRVMLTARQMDQLRGIDHSVTVVEVGPLSDAAAEELIEAQSVVPEASVRGEIIRWSAGNPLALIESARFYGRSGSASFRANHMVGSGFATALFAVALSELPADTRRLTLFAAAGAGYETAEAITAAAGFGRELSRWEPAITAGLLVIGVIAGCGSVTRCCAASPTAREIWTSAGPRTSLWPRRPTWSCLVAHGISRPRRPVGTNPLRRCWNRAPSSHSVAAATSRWHARCSGPGNSARPVSTRLDVSPWRRWRRTSAEIQPGRCR